jgi:hypothetical protein
MSPLRPLVPCGPGQRRLRALCFEVASGGRAKTDWYDDPRDSGTAFCFEEANVRSRFCAICVRDSVTYATERPSN